MDTIPRDPFARLLIEDRQPLCDECAENGVMRIATVAYLGHYECSEHAMEYLGKLPALAFAGANR